jgi:hypothetical protein
MAIQPIPAVAAASATADAITVRWPGPRRVDSGA